MNKNTTKRSLLASILALVMCVTMLVGTTFAWFTDTASTGVNKIQAGNLDVALEMATEWDKDGNVTKWANAEGKTLQFKKAATAPEGEEILWEPGCRYVLPELRVVNNGNLALKYKIVITGIGGDVGLNKVIDWTMNLNGTTFDIGSEHKLAAKTAGTVDADVLTIQGRMQETAGNEYQKAFIDGIGITVYATQDTVESDSFGDQYDENAAYDTKNVLFADSVASLKAAAAAAKAGDEIILSDDITVSETITFDASKIVLNGNGHTITADMSTADVENLKTVLCFGHDNVYCTGVTVKNLNFKGNGGRAMHFHGGTSSVLENVNISGNWSLAINFYGTHGAVMNNCHISSDYANKYAKSSIFANEQSANQIILNNTTVDSMFVNVSDNGAAYANDGIKVVVNSGSSINELHINQGETRTCYQLNGGTVGSVQADVE